MTSPSEYISKNESLFNGFSARNALKLALCFQILEKFGWKQPFHPYVEQSLKTFLLLGWEPDPLQVQMLAKKYADKINFEDFKKVLKTLDKSEL